MKTGLYILIVSLGFNPLQGWAADQVTAPSTTIGRLFFTPGERSSLDTIRRSSKAPDKVITAGNIEEDHAKTEIVAITAVPVMVQGYIRRSDGKNTIWINNQAMIEKSSTKEFAVGNLQKNSGQVKVTVNGGEKKSVALKPGQIYDPNSGKVYNHVNEVPRQQIVEEESKSIVDEDEKDKKREQDELKKQTSDFANPSASKSESATSTGR